MQIELEATIDLKPLARMVLPPGEYNGVSVCALSANVKQYWMILNSQKTLDCHQNSTGSSHAMHNPPKHFVEIRS